MAVHFIAPRTSERRRMCDACFDRLKGFSDSGLTQSPPVKAEGAAVMAFASRMHLELFLEAMKPTSILPTH